MNKTDQAIETYGINSWGAGYFSVSGEGNLVIHPAPGAAAGADVKQIIEELAERGIHSPVLLRFPQVIASQVRLLQQAFLNATAEFEYEGRHLAVYPLKVNQKRIVIETCLQAGNGYGFGLEAGSKSELYAALALPQHENSLLVLNGFKDSEFMDLAFLAARIGKRVVVVIERLNELEHYLARTASAPAPMLGIRVKLYSKGSGRWEKSGGAAAKFGLTSTEVLEVIRRLRQVDMLHTLKLLHFHIGSQLTDIKRIKNAVKEAARVYAKIYKMAVPIEFLDVGGGLAVDYDGSNSSFASSANYSMQEFANDVVYQTKLVVDEEEVPHPTIVTESGRVLAAYHALLVTNVQCEIETVVEEVTPLSSDGDEPQVVSELDDLNRTINAKNFHEYYHDALEARDQLFTLFDLGLIDLEQRARGEVLFWDVCEKVYKFSRHAGIKYSGEEFDELRKLLCAKYLTNFSVFATLPDHWALDQLFPVVPIHRLNVPAESCATLCDITCDSDGVVDKFVHMHDIKDVLEVHDLDPNKPYYLAFCMLGAYQEVMGNIHNLFGNPHEAVVEITAEGYRIQKIVRGSSICDTLEWACYRQEELHLAFRNQLDQQIRRGKMSPIEAEELVDQFEQAIGSYTYLAPMGGNHQAIQPSGEWQVARGKWGVASGDAT